MKVKDYLDEGEYMKITLVFILRKQNARVWTAFRSL
jgi:hypothetical protein